MLHKSALSGVDCKIRYVTVVVSAEYRDFFKEKWTVNKRDRSIDCSPRLDYDLFATGEFPAQLDAYIVGIGTAVGLFPRLGLSTDDASEFQRILAGIPNEGPNDNKVGEDDGLLSRIRKAAAVPSTIRGTAKKPAGKAS